MSVWPTMSSIRTGIFAVQICSYVPLGCFLNTDGMECPSNTHISSPALMLHSGTRPNLSLSVKMPFRRVSSKTMLDIALIVASPLG